MQLTKNTYSLSKLTAKIPLIDILACFVPATEPKTIDVPFDLIEGEIASLWRAAYLVSLLSGLLVDPCFFPSIQTTGVVKWSQIFLVITSSSSHIF